jgi:RNA polymerase sigma factor (sigma-70 family)
MDDDQRERFREVFEELYLPILRLLMRKGANYQTAKDVIHDTFLVLARERPWHVYVALSPNAGGAYVKRIARNIYRNNFRRESMRASAAPLDAEAVPSQERDPDFRQSRREFLSLLSARERKIMILTERGLKPVEIAKELGLSYPTVTAGIRKCKQLFDAWLQGEN